MNSDTPRTDEQAATNTHRYGVTMGRFVRADFARQLERELNEVREREQKWKAMAQEVISKFKHNHVNNGIDDACKQCGFDLRHEIHIRFNSINKCHHGIRDTATNLPYCRKCDEEGLK